MIFGIILGLFVGNNYIETDNATTYISSYEKVENDKFTSTIIAVKEGKNPLTYQLLILNDDEIIVDINN
jgi:hypothetical protein